MDLSPDDHVAIRQLYARYAWAIDLGDVDAYVATWTDDGEFVGYREGGTPHAKGHEALGGLVSAIASDPSKTGYHWTTTPIVEATDYGAQGRCYMTHILQSEEGIGELRHALHYEDELVKRDGNWLFRRRNTRTL